MDLASVVAALASVGVRVSGSAPNSSVQVDSSRACPPGLAGPEPSGTIHDLGQHFHTGSPVCTGCMCSTGFPTGEAGSEVDSRSTSSSNSWARKALCFRSTQLGSAEGIVLAISDSWSSASSFTAAGSR